MKLTSKALLLMAIIRGVVLGSAASASPQPGSESKQTLPQVRFEICGKWPAEYVRGSISSIRVAGDHAYVAIGGRLVIYEITPAGKISHQGVCVLPGAAKDIALHGPWAYVACGSQGLAVIDVKNPHRPMEAGRCKGNIRDGIKVSVAGRIACVLDAGEGIRLIDISAPASPTELGFVKTSGPAQSVFIHESRLYIGAEGMEIWDIKYPEKPTRLSTWPSTGGWLCPFIKVEGSVAYLGNARRHLDLIDVSDPMHPKAIGGLGTIEFGNAHEIYLHKDFAFLASDRLHVVDLKDRNKPKKLWTYEDDYYSTLDGDGPWLVAGGGSTIHVFDISDPEFPMQDSQLTREGRATDVRINGN